jgi:hypothetical protein
MSNERVPLAEFATLHAIPMREAERLYKMGMIAGSRAPGTARRLGSIEIETQGKRDFWVQCHDMPGFRACDECPHS